MAFAVPQFRVLMRVLAFLALALAFATPAFEIHACESPEPATATASAELPADEACPDCGPACANGCCHAPHAATPAETTLTLSGPAFAPIARNEWASPADTRPDGPERPPRA